MDTPPDSSDLVEPPEGWWEAVLAFTSDAVVTLALDGTITSWNSGAERLCGYAPGNILGQGFQTLTADGRRNEIDEVLFQVGAGQAVAPFETEWTRRDGSRVDVSVAITPLIGSSRAPEGAAVIARDVSDRKRFESLLAQEVSARESYQEELVDLNRQLQERLEMVGTLLEVLPVGIGIAFDKECTQVRLNSTLARILGTQAGTVFLAEGFPGKDSRFRLVDGKKTLTREDFPLRRAAATGEPVSDLELEIYFDDGRSTYVLCFAAPLLTDEGEPRGAICAFVDVTEKREAEAQLFRANAIRDEFLSLVSHELRTPLTVVLGLARFLSRDAAGMDRTLLQETLGQMRSDAERLANVIENMLLLSRLDFESADMEPVRVRSVVERAVSEHRSRYPYRSVETDIESGAFVEGHNRWLEQIVTNLLSNAEKYSPPDEPVLVSVSDTSTTIEIKVSDRGPGIDADDAAELFQPFYRSKRARDAMIPGLGLGLTVGKRLTELQGGAIQALPRDGGGSQFVVTLPALVASEELS